MKTEKNILVAFLLNVSFSIFEFIGGIFTNSVVGQFMVWLNIKEKVALY